MIKKKKIAIDFDGVLIDGQGIPRKVQTGIGNPKKDAVAGVKFLQDLGYDCFVLTARDPEEWGNVKKWLDKHGFPEMEIGNTKKSAIAYIDDRGIRFTNWQDVCRYFG